MQQSIQNKKYTERLKQLVNSVSRDAKWRAETEEKARKAGITFAEQALKEAQWILKDETSK